jgi:hypothetical protein
MWRIIFVLIISLSFAACSSTGAESTDDSAQPQAVQIEAVDRAEAVLSEQLNVDPESIQVLKVEDAEWQDSCLGLGQANESCLRENTPGYRITLDAGGKQYIYRTDKMGIEVRLEEITE